MGTDPTKIDLKITYQQIKTQPTNRENQQIPQMGESVLVAVKTSLTICVYITYNDGGFIGYQLWRLGRPTPSPG